MAKPNFPADFEVRRFFVSNAIRKFYEKVENATKPVTLERIAATSGGILYHTFSEAEQAMAPEAVVSGTPLKAVVSGKTTRLFCKVAEATVKFSPKQLAAICKFDQGLVDAAVKVGLISAEQASAIELPPARSEFSAH